MEKKNKVPSRANSKVEVERTQHKRSSFAAYTFHVAKVLQKHRLKGKERKQKMDKVSSLADPRPAKGRLTATKQSLSYSCWSFGLSGQEAGWQDLRLTRGMSAMLLLLKCPSPLPNCFLSPKCSVRPLSFFQVLVRVCPLTSLSLGPHSLWGPKPDTGDLGCWYVPNVGGIQQLSECPRMRHSCVHISVASTRPRGPRGPSAEREA